MASAVDSHVSDGVSADSRPLAIITGGRQGIGEAIARAFACSGYDVVIADVKRAADAKKLQQRWGCKGRLYCLQLDVTREARVTAFYQQLAKLGYHAPDVLVNNAATQTWGPMIDMALKDWQKTLDVNLTGMFLMTREFARRCRDASANNMNANRAIINLGSGCNRLAFPNLSAYVTSKGGVEMLTKASALELGELGIRVNCIAPGAIETERTQAETDNYAQSWSPLTPLGRIGTVNDVAEAVLALAGDGMRFVSGETINVDGGVFQRSAWPAEY